MLPPPTEKRMPYLPALDGLRAISVIAVLLYHAEVSWLPAGFLGVEVFFVVSGYLITALLLREVAETGGVDVRRFWARRFRRLVPAVVALLIGTVLYLLVFARNELDGLFGEIVASLAYVTNWFAIFGNVSYFDSLGRPSPLRHLWSLAIEEQFYLIWPVVLVAGLRRFGRARTMAAIAVGIVASTLAMGLLYVPLADPSRVYYGTDTRAAALLVGALLAMAWRPWNQRLSRSLAARIDLLGVAALAGLAVAAWRISEFDDALYRGGFLLVSILTAIVIAAAARPTGLLSTVLGPYPLRWLGVRSYSIYLWHWPVFVFTRPGLDIDLGPNATLALRLALTLALAQISYVAVERPLRAGKWQLPTRVARRQLVPVGAAGIIMALIAILAPPASAGMAAAATSTVAVALEAPTASAPNPEVMAAPREADDLVDPAVASPQPAPPEADDDDLGPPAAPQPPALVTTPDRAVPATAKAPPPTLDGSLEAVARDAVGPPPSTTQRTVTTIGDSVLLGAAPALTDAFGDQISIDAEENRGFTAAASVAAASESLGAVVVIHLGNNGPINAEVFDELMTAIGPERDVYFVTVRVPRRWQDVVNETLVDGVERWPNAMLIDWYAHSENRPEWFVSDGVHLEFSGQDAYAEFVAASIDS